MLIIIIDLILKTIFPRVEKKNLPGSCEDVPGQLLRLSHILFILNLKGKSTPWMMPSWRKKKVWRLYREAMGNLNMDDLLEIVRDVHEWFDSLETYYAQAQPTPATRRRIIHDRSDIEMVLRTLDLASGTWFKEVFKRAKRLDVVMRGRFESCASHSRATGLWIEQKKILQKGCWWFDIHQDPNHEMRSTYNRIQSAKRYGEDYSEHAQKLKAYRPSKGMLGVAL